jgi:hypothetical protein
MHQHLYQVGKKHDTAKRRHGRMRSGGASTASPAPTSTSGHRHHHGQLAPDTDNFNRTRHFDDCPFRLNLAEGRTSDLWFAK